MHWLIEPGFFANEPIRVALVVGSLVAIATAVVGVFVVLRGQSFAGHALTDVATAGGAGAHLVGWAPLAGFVAGGLLGAGAMDAIGENRVRGRDFATGIVLGAATGLAALFFYLSSSSNVSGTTQSVLFGSLITVSLTPWITPAVSMLCAAVVVLVVTIARPLLLSSISTELAVARGVNLRIIGWCFLVTLALAVALSAVVLGSILSTTLLIGPPAVALRLTRRLRSSFIVAGAVGVVATWLGTVLAYDSYYWSDSHRALPVSFFVVLITVLAYVSATFASSSRRRRRRSGHGRLVVSEQ